MLASVRGSSAGLERALGELERRGARAGKPLDPGDQNKCLRTGRTIGLLDRACRRGSGVWRVAELEQVTRHLEASTTTFGTVGAGRQFARELGELGSHVGGPATAGPLGRNVEGPGHLPVGADRRPSEVAPALLGILG